MSMQGENFQPQPDQIANIKSQAAQLKEKIKLKETEVGNPISYSLGKGDREVIILAQPIQQQVEIDWGNKMRLVDRNRYIVVGSFGIGAIDFIKQAKFDASDNLPETNNKQSLSPKAESAKYPEEGIWIKTHGSDEDNGQSEKSMLRSLGSLNGVDKLTPAMGLAADVVTVMHDNDGFGILSDGSPVMSVAVDFRARISQSTSVEEFTEALQKSVEKAKPVELHTDATKQASLLSAALASF